MDVRLEQLGKRFSRDWVIRSMNHNFKSGRTYAVRGPNGSGKSTLLRMISGFLTPSRGTITHRLEGRSLSRDQVYRYVNFGAPYIELIEEFSLRELLSFHRDFRPFVHHWTIDDILGILSLDGFEDERIEDFSSGMKQRLRLVLALCTESPLILLDEPGTNLDREGKHWFSDLMVQEGSDKTVIIASNDPDDFEHCDDMIEVTDFK